MVLRTKGGFWRNRGVNEVIDYLLGMPNLLLPACEWRVNYVRGKIDARTPGRALDAAGRRGP